MEDPIRIMVVETCAGTQRLARELLHRYDLDFQWRCVGSPAEAGSLEAAYAPDMVLSANQPGTLTTRTVLDAFSPFRHEARSLLLVSIDETAADVERARHCVDLLEIPATPTPAPPAPSAGTPRLKRQPFAHAAHPARLERGLRAALHHNALDVDYQPQYECSSGRGCGVEALARWTVAGGGHVGPAVFIPMAEAAGMIEELGEWILRAACGTATSWLAPLAQGATLSVNVSTLQINERFLGVIARGLADSGFPASRLELEITESALIANTPFVIDQLTQWRRLGVRVALDDFGAGYSSFGYLARLPLDRLKLDRSLVHTITDNVRGAAVVRSIIALCAELSVDVVAEGVETEDQLRMLTDFGCQQVQGYLLARPLRARNAQGTLCRTFGNRPMSGLQRPPAMGGRPF